jgi:MoaA/NifB/PqqE/SkfB family radical SAM enzyme
MVDMCYEGRVPKVHICATGEPFMHKDVLSMMDYTIDVYGSVSIQTDFFQPLFEKQNYLDAIVARGDSISCIITDILSGDPDIHESIKKGSSFKYIMSSMEYLSSLSNIVFEIHYIITKYNYKNLTLLINELAKRKINCYIAIVNLHASGFNDFTSPRSAYKESDINITNALKQAESLGLEKGIKVSLPTPVDKNNGQCGSFWTRFQTWPVEGIDESRYAENVIVGGCNAVVRGNLNTLGYMFDYDNVMDLWNNKYFVEIRENLLKGVYPDDECKVCQNYKRIGSR